MPLMTNSVLLRSLRIYRGLPSSFCISGYRCLAGDAKMPWTNSISTKSAIVPIRPFSSKLAGDDEVKDVKSANPSWHQATAYSTNTVSAEANKHFDDDVTQSTNQKDMSMMKLVAYKIVKAPDGDVRVEGNNGQQYSLNEIGPFAFRTMKEKAESYLLKGVASQGKKRAECYLLKRLSKVMIIVPEYFSKAQRQATKDAAKIAGLAVTKIVDETTTSKLYYEMNKTSGDAIAVFDLSGGTFDLSIKLILNCYSVCEEASDTFEASVLEHFVGELKNSHGIDLSKNQLAFKRIQDVTGKAKKELLSTWTATSQNNQINLPIF